MSLAAALSTLRAAGLTLAADASGLTLRGSGARPSADTLGALRGHRDQLALLVARPSGATLPAVVRYVTRPTELPAAAEDIGRQEAVGFDVETTGLDPLLDRLRLVQVAIPGGLTYVFDVALLGDLGPVVSALRDIEVVGHNLAFDLPFAAHHLGLRPRGAWCTLVASKLLDSGLNAHTKGFHSLGGVVERHLGIVLPKDDQKSDWSSALSPRQIEYAARDAAVVLVLRDLLRDALVEHELADVAALEFALLPVVADMWLAGVGFDGPRWDVVVAERTSEAEALRVSLQRALLTDGSCDLGEEVNPNSQRQVLAALRRQGLPIQRTNKETLAPFAANPIVRDLLKYRSLTSFVRGPGAALPAAAARYSDGRIRARLDPLAAPTGRFGCSGPNLQGLEKGRKKGSGADGVPEPRSCIVPAPGHVFIDADYAAIELRVLAQITGDTRLKQIFQSGGDPHRTMGATVARKPESDVTKEERDRAKAVNFGFPFGMGVDRFIEYALALYGVVFTPAEATAFKAAWKRMFPGVVRWQTQMGNAAPPGVRSRSGRRRCFASRFEGYCERLNMPVQGTAADGMKLAMVWLHQRLRGFGARLLLTIHDENLVECPLEHAAAVMELVVRTMVEAMATYVPDVPIVVEADVRASWSARDLISLEATS